MAPRRPSAPRAGSARPATSAPSSRTTAPRTTTPRTPGGSSRGSGSRGAGSRSSAARGATPGGSSRPATGATPRVRRPSRSRRAAGRVAGMLPETITTRTLVLAGAILLAFVILLPTAREYVTQSADLRALHADLAETQQQKAAAQAELDRWSDPAYQKAQARARLGYEMPGDKAYRVIDPKTVDDALSPLTGRPVTAGVVDAGAADDGEPWYRTMWTSVEVAGAGVTSDGKDAATSGTGKESKDGA